MGSDTVVASSSLLSFNSVNSRHWNSSLYKHLDTYEKGESVARNNIIAIGSFLLSISTLFVDQVVLTNHIWTGFHCMWVNRACGSQRMNVIYKMQS